jgi:FKBP-type peptidyl-prolyl cis-trans isomerase FkpA
MRRFSFASATALAFVMLPACGTTAKPLPPGALKCRSLTASGLGYQMLKAGKGAKPTAADNVTVDYIGYFPKNGKVFDAGKGSAFPVSGMVSGFSEGLQLMETGATYRLCVPARLGYGARAIGPIAANSDLVFQVRLLSINGQ